MTPETTDFLYPFIDAEPGDPAPLLVDLASSATAKALQSARLRDATVADAAPELDEVATEMAARFLAGGRLFTMGNGGSSTDADAVPAMLFGQPPYGPALARTLAGVRRGGRHRARQRRRIRAGVLPPAHRLRAAPATCWWGSPRAGTRTT